MTLLGQIERGQREIGHAFERNQVTLFKCVRMIGKKLEESAHLAVAAQHGQNHDRGDAESAAGLEVHPRIGFGIIAT